MPSTVQVVMGLVSASTLKPSSQARVQVVVNARLPDESALVPQGQVPLVTPGRALTGHTTGAAAMCIMRSSGTQYVVGISVVERGKAEAQLGLAACGS